MRIGVVLRKRKRRRTKRWLVTLNMIVTIVMEKTILPRSVCYEGRMRIMKERMRKITI